MEYDAEAAAQIRPTKEQVEDQLLKLNGVVGVDIGEKFSNGKPTGELSIVVMVKDKKSPSKVAKSQEIPPELDGIKTDVQEMDIELQHLPGLMSAEPQTDPAHYPQVRGGISIGPARFNSAGTLGAMVGDQSAGGAISIVTNFHVACVDEAWSAGEAMIQPGRFDGGNVSTQQFGTLTRGVLSERVDGAVVKLDSGQDWEDTVVNIGQPNGSAAAAAGMAVQKRGRTTEHTHGQVVSVDASVSVNYGSTIGVRTLRHQIRISPDPGLARFSDRGDSGSVIMTNDRKVVGLLFAGATDGSATFANPIASVLSELNISLNPPRLRLPPLVTRVRSVCEVVTRASWCEIQPPVTRYPVCNLHTSPVLCQINTSPIVCRVTRPQLCQRIPDWKDLPVPNPFGGAPGADQGQGTAGAGSEEFLAGYLTAMSEVARDLDELDAGEGGQQP